MPSPCLARLALPSAQSLEEQPQELQEQAPTNHEGKYTYYSSHQSLALYQHIRPALTNPHRGDRARGLLLSFRNGLGLAAL